MKHMNILAALICGTLLVPVSPAHAIDIRKVDVSTRGGFVDYDVNFVLDRAEVRTLSSDATKAIIAAKLTASGGPYGAILAVYVLERIKEIQDAAQGGGASVKTTVRTGVGGTRLHVFSLGGCENPC